jgi:hypothetical protein
MRMGIEQEETSQDKPIRNAFRASLLTKCQPPELHVLTANALMGLCLIRTGTAHKRLTNPCTHLLHARKLPRHRTFLAGVPGACDAAAASPPALLAMLLGSRPTLINRSTSVPSCCCPTACPAAGAAVVPASLNGFRRGSSSSRSDRSLPCLSNPARSVVQLPSCNTTQHNTTQQQHSTHHTALRTH